MFTRAIEQELAEWAEDPLRKPLVLRGARQVGKTTLIHQFSSNFKQYIYLNLELSTDRKLFEDFKDIKTLVQAIFFSKNKTLVDKENTLLFIDEFQEYPDALNVLRYFYEQEPSIAVIAAGSMLEYLFNKDIHFPVGRATYKVLRPVSFPEFLAATGEITALNALNEIPLPEFAHEKLKTLFHTYALIGGMPEIVAHFATYKDLAALAPLYDSLISSYLDDVEKYASSDTQIVYIRHAIRSSFAEAGKRITFAGFGRSTYRSRDMSEALRVLEQALLLYLIYPDTAATLPLQPDMKKSPRLQFLDTGLVNYFIGIQKEILGTSDLDSVYQGTMIEHLVGQEMLAVQHKALSRLHFWARDKNSSSAEVDFLLQYESKIIPVEVKSGAEGKLKSLHMFMDKAPHNIAVRLYAGSLLISQGATAEGKKFNLLNVPYYLGTKLKEYLGWFEKEIEDSDK